MHREAPHRAPGPRRSQAPERFVLAVGGRVASGKSTIARDVASAADAQLIVADALRDELLDIGTGQREHEAAWRRNLETDVTARVYDALFEQAGQALAQSDGVVLDGCFSSREQRELAQRLAREHAATFLFVECHAAESVIRERLEARSRKAGIPVESWQTLERELRSHWEPTDHLDREQHLRIDTGEPLDSSIGRVRERVAQLSSDADRAAESTVYRTEPLGRESRREERRS